MLDYPTYLDDMGLDECAECGVALPETNDTGFCCAEHQDVYVARQRKADDEYAKALVEEAKFAAEWKAEEARERALPAAEAFEVPERLLPSKAYGLSMTMHFMRTPARERV